MTKQLITDKIWLVPELNIKENRQAESAKDCKLSAPIIYGIEEKRNMNRPLVSVAITMIFLPHSSVFPCHRKPKPPLDLQLEFSTATQLPIL